MEAEGRDSSSRNVAVKRGKKAWYLSFTLLLQDFVHVILVTRNFLLFLFQLVDSCSFLADDLEHVF